MPIVAQYTTDANLAKRQRLWQVSPRSVDFDLFGWVVGMVEGTDVLDVGCGNGAYLGRIRGAVGMDLSMGMLESARPTGRPLVNADVQALPFADASFDTALAPHMLYHVPDRRQAARELRRVTRPGGVCIAVTNGAHAHQSLTDILESVAGNGWRWERPSSTAFSMENGAEQLRAGFEHVEIRWAPDVVFSVTDADALADYIDSCADPYAGQITWKPWDVVVRECRARAAEIIDRDGVLPITGTLGAFVCR
jgi:SAM-dependent methyltransferase